MTTKTSIKADPDFTVIKTKQNAAWASGDYARIGSTLQIVGEQLAETMDLSPGSSTTLPSPNHTACLPKSRDKQVGHA